MNPVFHRIPVHDCQKNVTEPERLRTECERLREVQRTDDITIKRLALLVYQGLNADERGEPCYCSPAPHNVDGDHYK